MTKTYFILQGIARFDLCSGLQFWCAQVIFVKTEVRLLHLCILHIQTVVVSCCQDAPHFTIDGKLKDILKVTPGACLQYAVIEGNQVFSLPDTDQ